MSQLFRVCSNNLAHFRRFCTHSTPEIHEKTINNVQILGRVGAHPQKRGNDEHPVVVFSLATNSSYRYETGDVSQKTEWHRVCVFKPTLRDMILNYMKKGNRVLVNGRLMYGSFTGEDGSLKNSTSIVADDIIFFQGKQELAP